MAETSREIRRQIDDTRARIGGTIAALESKVDPHRIMEEHPIAAVAVAFGTGLLLAGTGVTGDTARALGHDMQERTGGINDTARAAVDGLLNAILGAAAATIASKVSEALHTAFGGMQKGPRTVHAVDRAA